MKVGPMGMVALLLGVLIVGLPVGEVRGAATACLDCHNDGGREEFLQSVHGHNACTSCHVDVTDVDLHMAGQIKPGAVDCQRCHKQEASQHLTSVHMENDLSCASCHESIHSLSRWQGDKQQAVQSCQGCHDLAGYAESVHGQGVMAGKKESAACHDCHGLHAVTRVGAPGSRENMAFHTKVCMGCHGNEEMMKSAGVFPLTVATYLDNYHGKGYRLGFPEETAGCADCHTAHRILPSTHAESSVNPANLQETCGQCHAQATALFTRFFPHGDHHDRAKYPILYWTYLSMTTLLVSTFAIFWIHTLLWMFRGFVENRQKAAALAMAAEVAHINADGTATMSSLSPAMAMTGLHMSPGGAAVLGHAHHPMPDAHKQYRRFESRHIFLHLTVIVSFLGLSLTGLPLKFSDQAWAVTMMSFFGGVHYAGLIHRGCAILTFYYFIGALIMAINFLFIRKDVLTPAGHRAHWLQRLFGPDSLMPNFRDVKDITGMVRWFFFRGPKPSFERWTYWEKFDFLAVFWGMFAIGGSGLLLWFPEFSGSFLPGWMFNVATIVHSDEALLATGFIFTVHFFNTHGRPEKFPMDFVIFNGQMSKEEFIEERGDQWRRLEQTGELKLLEAKKTSGILYDMFFKIFGFAAFFTGVTLACLMLLAFVAG
jgi:cytochrome b subunit of formate dehydrogenase